MKAIKFGKVWRQATGKLGCISTYLCGGDALLEAIEHGGHTDLARARQSHTCFRLSRLRASPVPV